MLISTIKDQEKLRSQPDTSCSIKEDRLCNTSSRFPNFSRFETINSIKDIEVANKSISNRFQRKKLSLNDYFTPKRDRKQSLNTSRYRLKPSTNHQSIVRIKEEHIVSKKAQLRHLNLAMRINQASESIQNSCWNGKTHKFINSFHNSMYENTRIDSYKLKFRREKNHKRSLERKEQQKMRIFNEIKTKNMVAKFFKHRFGVHAKYSQIRKFSSDQLEEMLLKKGLKKTRARAAILIQKIIRGYIFRVNYKKTLIKREKAVIKIQNSWKRYRMLTMIPKVIKERKKRAFVIIQKYMKGYRDYTRYKYELKHFSLVNNFKFFNKIRQKLYVNSHIVISYWWRRYKRRKAKQLERQELIKKSSKKKNVSRTERKPYLKQEKVEPKITKVSRPAFPARRISTLRNNTLAARRKSQLGLPILSEDILNINNSKRATLKHKVSTKGINTKETKFLKSQAQSALLYKKKPSVSNQDVLGGDMKIDGFKKKFETLAPTENLTDSDKPKSSKTLSKFHQVSHNNSQNEVEMFEHSMSLKEESPFNNKNHESTRRIDPDAQILLETSSLQNDTDIISEKSEELEGNI
ncbi:unnamed protein product [Moneuplotes crassus]|uniref:Uncharacterized protein n=1 Tax=Euplotes crassus TaxID=5936 RepID=A0AAD1Y425_EUPCR|nr:unnamed protein product [Moneuplotes crassus]